MDFGELFESWYDTQAQKARPISELIDAFADNGNFNVHAACDDLWWQGLSFPHFGAHFDGTFTATDWNSMDAAQREEVLMCFRIAYLADSEVNWCPALGTVLANDEVKDGLSERGGHPVVKKTMRQWMMRITAYADRLLTSLDDLDWTDSVKEAQRHWIGRSEGASVRFAVANSDGQLDPSGAEVEVFTTRPDTLHGVSFMVLAPEHDLVASLTTDAQRAEVEAYVEAAGLKSERDRQGDKSVSRVFTGGHVVHPLTGALVPVWIADYVLAGYGTGAIMAVPAGDERDWRFATHFELPIPAIFEGANTDEAACTDKGATLCNSDAWNGMRASDAIPLALDWVEAFWLRHPKSQLPHPRRGVQPPALLGRTLPDRLRKRHRPTHHRRHRDLAQGRRLPAHGRREPPWPVPNAKTGPCSAARPWKPTPCPVGPAAAGTSCADMDPHNDQEFCAREKSDYWGQVDLYVGGAEHTTGHLLYSRFWTKFLYDLGHIGFDEPFKFMINQGMILGRSSFVYRVQGTNTFVTATQRKAHSTQRLHVDINLVEGDKLTLTASELGALEFANAEFILDEDGSYTCGHEVEKMSKSKYNVQTPDDLVERYGADTLRCYEMFLGPLTQHKPWDTQGISGVHNFLRKIQRVYTQAAAEAGMPATSSEDALRVVHKAIAKVTDDLDRHAFNTVVSALMIAVNDLAGHTKEVGSDALQPLAVLLSPYAPHCGRTWATAQGQGSVLDASWPEANEAYLLEDQITYPISFNGKVRFKMDLAASLSPADVEAAVKADDRTSNQLDGKEIRKMIVVQRAASSMW